MKSRNPDSIRKSPKSPKSRKSRNPDSGISDFFRDFLNGGDTYNYIKDLFVLYPLIMQYNINHPEEAVILNSLFFTLLNYSHIKTEHFKYFFVIATVLIHHYGGIHEAYKKLKLSKEKNVKKLASKIDSLIPSNMKT